MVEVILLNSVIAGFLIYLFQAWNNVIKYLLGNAD